MHPRICINGISSWNWTVDEDIAFYRKSGITNIAVGFPKLEGGVQERVDAIKAAGLNVVSVAGGGQVSLIDGDALDALKPAIDAAASLGSESMYFVAGMSPPRMPTDEAYAALVENLAPANAYARSKGVRLALEHNSIVTRAHGFIHMFADAADFARDADIGIDLELQNCWYERHLERLFKDNVDRIALVQVSDFIVGEDVHLNRCVPGDGGIPLEWMIARILDAGYTGFFDLEMLGPHIEKEGYASAITRGADWLAERLTKWGA